MEETETENIKTQNSINKGTKNIKCQNINKYKKNTRFDYDLPLIKEFREKFPEVVKQLEEEAIEQLPYLKHKHYKKFLDKKVDILILPPVLEKLDGYFYWEKDAVKGRTAGGYHHNIDNYQDKIESDNKNTNGGERMMMDEMLGDLMEELTLEEDTIVKMWYGIEPYETQHTAKEIFKGLSEPEKIALGLNKLQVKEAEKVIEEKIKQLVNKLRDLLAKKD